MFNALESLSIRPYLIRALYEWCTDNGHTPYVAVQVDDTVQVPREYVKNNEIVLNVSLDATSALKLGNEFVEFKARFAGVAREIIVPVGRVIAVYARENGEGMAFPALPVQSEEQEASQGTSRDALRGPEGDPGRIVHLVTGEADEDATQADSAPGDPENPPRPPAGGNPRPSLKRIK
jgi:stringent starvation protein B